MPMRSKAQRAYLHAKHPEIAKRFEAETPKNAKLPEHAKTMMRKRKSANR
jgi:hypothetical protein